MTTESQTPRTDALVLREYTNAAPIAHLMTGLARILERQLALAIEMRDGYRKAGNELVADIAQLMSVRIILGKGGKGFAYVIGNEYPHEGYSTPQEALDAARAALAGKVQS